MPFMKSDRCRGAIWGQFVGDAACLGSHWIYDLNELARRYPDGIIGFDPPLEGHYHWGKRPGELTHYGDAALLMLESVAEKGRFDAVDFGRRFVALFGSDAYTGYIDHATRDTLANYRAFCADHPGEPFSFQSGADDHQPATVTRLAPVLVAHADDPGLLDRIAAATRVCQASPRAVKYAQAHATILRELLTGCGLEEALGRAARITGGEPAQKIREALAAAHLSVRNATERFGQSCPLASSFPAAIHAAVRYETSFVDAILETARAGGDSAGRAAMIGAWLGTLHGVRCVPKAWRRKLACHDLVERDVERLVSGQ